MMPHFQLMLAWMMSTQGSNITFAVLCLMALCGVPARLVLALTIALHLALAFA